MSKVFLQQQVEHDFYMFPGGRLEINEQAETAIVRELNEELGIKDELITLKFISENFILFPKKKYHEIGFYFVTKIDEKKYNYYSNNVYDSLDEENDGKSKFRWVSIDELDNISIVPNYMKNIISNMYTMNNNEIEHIVYREYD